MNTTVLEAVEITREIDNTDQLEEELLEIYGWINIGGLEFHPARIIQELDPIAWRCEFAANEEETVWECPICGAEYSDDEEAKWCCQEEPEDGETENY